MVGIGAADDAIGLEVEPLLLHSQQLKPSFKPKRNDHYQATAATATQVAGSVGSSSSDMIASSWYYQLLQFVLVASIIVYIAAYMLFPSSPVQFVYLVRLADWWTEPATTADGAPKEHPDMGRPTFLFLFGVLPFAVGVLALEALRGPHNAHRVVSRHVLQLGLVLRRTPSSSQMYLPSYLGSFSIGELVFLAFLVGGNLVLFVFGWICMSSYYPLAGESYTFYTTLQVLGVVLGYSCVFNMALLFVPATRNSAWMEFMGISYANGMKFHRWLGVATVVTAVGHALPFYPIWYHKGQLWVEAMPCWDCSLDYFSKGYPAWFNVFGELSLFFMLVIAVTSVPWIRRNLFETFYYAHYAFVPAVVFAVLHWGLIVWWLLPTFTIYLVDRVVGGTNTWTPTVIEQCTVLGDGILKVVVRRSTQRGGGFEVGQFVYMKVPAISTLQWHPFTIGSSPRANPTSFTIWLKSLGDWTEDLVEHVRMCEQNCEQPTVHIDGFYGASLESFDQYATLCLVGGGIGVTPLFAILEDIGTRITRPPAAAPSSRWPRSCRIHFVFSFRELVLLEEIHPVLRTLRACPDTRDLFSWDFFLTRVPCEAMLNEHLQHHRRSTLRNNSTREEHVEKRNACPFAEQLRGRTYRAVLFATVLVASSSLVLFLDFDGGVFMAHGAKTQYWPLQNFVDSLVLFAIPPIAYLFILVEKFATRLLSKGKNGERDVHALDVCRTEITRPAFSVRTDLVTYRDLLAEYNVTVGQRPDMKKAMSKVHSDFVASRSEPPRLEVLANMVGVFVSGPETLKRATEDAVAAIDANCFDIHDEEFEL